MANIEVLRFPDVAAYNPQRIADAFSKNGNTAYVFIHPWFSTPILKDKTRDYADYSRKRNSFLAQNIAQGTMPIILEERYSSGILQNKLTRYNNSSDKPTPVFIIPTQISNPTPIYPYSFPQLAEQLSSLGATQVKLAGELLKIDDSEFNGYPSLVYSHGHTHELFNNERTSELLKESAQYIADKKGVPISNLLCAPWVKQPLPPKGCVGATAVFLLTAGLDVSITPATYPHRVPQIH